jgi:hypothetical protein
MPMASSANRDSGAIGFAGLPEPPPLRGSALGPLVPRASGLWPSLLALPELYTYARGAVPPKPVLGDVGTGATVEVGFGAGGVVAVAAGADVAVGGAAVVAVGFAVAVAFGFGVGVAVDTGSEVAVGAVVAVGAGVAVGVVGTPGGGPIGVGIKLGGGGGVLAAAKPDLTGLCIATASATMPAAMGNARPMDKRLFIQDSLRSGLRSGRSVD